MSPVITNINKKIKIRKIKMPIRRQVRVPDPPSGKPRFRTPVSTSRDSHVPGSPPSPNLGVCLWARCDTTRGVGIHRRLSDRWGGREVPRPPRRKISSITDVTVFDGHDFRGFSKPRMSQLKFVFLSPRPVFYIIGMNQKFRNLLPSTPSPLWCANIECEPHHKG